MHIADKRLERLSEGKCIAGGPDTSEELFAFICGGREMLQLKGSANVAC